MAKRNFFRKTAISKESTCSCGCKSKLGSRRNYPHGKGSKPIRTTFYRCKECGKATIIPSFGEGGKR